MGVTLVSFAKNIEVIIISIKFSIYCIHFSDAPHRFGIRDARMLRQGSEGIITKTMQHIRIMSRTFF